MELNQLPGFDATKSVFLQIVSAQGHGDNTPLATFASNSGAMVAGYEGTIIGIDYETVAGIRTPDLNADQIITVAGKDYVLQPAKNADGTPNKPKAPVIKFDSGDRTMTLGLLQQGQKKTTITWPGVGGAASIVKDSTQLTLKDLTDLVGKKLRCESYFTDDSRMINRNGPDGKIASSRPANCYTFTVLG